MAKSTTTTKANTKTTKKKSPTVKSAKTSKSTTTAKKTTAKKTVSKTAKKPAVKSKKTTAKKTVSKTVTKPSVKETKVTPVTKASRFEFINRTQTTIGAIFSLLAIIAGYFMNSDSVQILMGHLAKDELASSAGTVLAPAATVFYEIEFRWLLVTLLAIAAVLAFLRGSRFHANEEAGIKNRVQPARWVEFGVTGAVAFEIAALLNGVQDAVALKLSVISILVAAYLAWVYEREYAVTSKATRAIRSAALVLVSIPVLMLLSTMLSTYIYADVRSAWYAYAAAVVVSAGLLYTMRTLKSSTSGLSGVQSYFYVNRKFTLISVATKVTLAVIIITGLQK